MDHTSTHHSTGQTTPCRWRRATVLLTLLLALVFSPFQPAESAMDPQYCHVPGFIESGTNIKPNIMILLDNSLSMRRGAYTDLNSEWLGNDIGDENDYDVPSRFDPNANYFGYFDSGSCYAYVTDRFMLGPASGEPGDSSACDETTNGGFPFSGNFMNWAFMTRLEVARKVFIGAPWDETNGLAMFDRGLDNSERVVGEITDKYPTLEGIGNRDFCIDPEPYTDLPSGEGIHINRRDRTGGLGVREIQLAVLPLCHPALEAIGNIGGGHSCDEARWPLVVGPVIHTHGAASSCNVSGNYSSLDWRTSNPDAQLVIDTAEEPTGILHEMGESARWGLTYYDVSYDNYPGYSNDDIGHGGTVVHYFGDPVEDLIDQMRTLTTVLWTPTMEALQTVFSYINQGQQGGGANEADFGPDPRFYEPTEFIDYGVGTTWDPMYEWETGLNQFIDCRQNFVLVISDGEPARDEEEPPWIVPGGVDFDNDGYDENMPITNPVGWPPEVHNGDGIPPEDIDSWAPDGTGGWINKTDWLDDLALYGRTVDLRPDRPDKQIVRSSYIYAFGRQPFARYTMWQAAINGNFNDLNGDNRPDSQDEWDEDGDGEPDGFFFAEKGSEVENAIREALAAILNQVSAGSAPSIQPAGQAGGGIVAQTYFLPEYTDPDDDKLDWMGFMRGLWLDSAGNLREDGNTPGHLVPEKDMIVEFKYDTAADNVLAHLYDDPDGDGKKDNLVDKVPISDPNLDFPGIFEAGTLLHDRDWDDRTIYTHVDYPSDIFDTNGRYHFVHWTRYGNINRIEFDPGNWTAIDDHLGSRSGVGTVRYIGKANKTKNMINYIRGRGDLNPIWWRPRDVDWQGVDDKTWKLSDLMHSSPVIIGAPGGTYHTDYGSKSYLAYLQAHKDRPTVAYVGSNSGMLHAFAIGHYRTGDDITTPDLDAGYLEEMKDSYDAPSESSGSDVPIGTELWGYVPYNLLPQLHWLRQNDYCHTYYVDGDIVTRDARIFAPDSMHVEGWGTILLVPFRLGCKAIRGEVDPSPARLKWRRSGIMVLDVTNPLDPQPILEYQHPRMGFSVNTPAISRIGINDGTPFDDEPHCWYLQFGNGPRQYEFDRDWGGTTENRRGRVHVLPLGAHPLYQHSGCPDTWRSDPPLPMVPTATQAADVAEYTSRIPSYDLDLDGTVDVSYFGTVIDEGVNDWSGRVMRLVTDGDFDPNNWRIVPLIETDGPVRHSRPSLDYSTSGAFSDDGIEFNTGLYISFGTGIYEDLDHVSYLEQQSVYSIRDTCWLGANTRFGDPGIDPGCFEMDKASDLLDSTGCFLVLDDITGELTLGDGGCIESDFDDYKLAAASTKGWFIDLKLGERLIRDTIPFNATLLFATFNIDPTLDVCEEGGFSELYIVGSATGISFTEEPSPLGSGISTPIKFGSRAALSSSLGSLGFAENLFGRVEADGLSVLTRPQP